jgi:serine/threonine-protein kinase
VGSSSSKGQEKIVHLMPGMVVASSYKLCEMLGRGGFGQVWEAEIKDGRRVALKFIPCKRDMSAAKEVRAIQAVRRLNHPNLIAIDEIYTDLGYVIIAMELADGSLLDLLFRYQAEARSPIVPEKVWYYLAQAARVIDFLNSHEHDWQGQRVGFQHCDIKPSNLLLFDDVVKVSDFGLASPTAALIKPHRRVGTMIYAAPEVFQSRLSDWTDQYALAVSYCQLRGGRLPFPETSASFNRHYTRPAPDLSMLPERERPVIARALTPVPLARWPSCQELIARLAETST